MQNGGSSAATSGGLRLTMRNATTNGVHMGNGRCAGERAVTPCVVLALLATLLTACASTDTRAASEMPDPQRVPAARELTLRDLPDGFRIDDDGTPGDRDPDEATDVQYDCEAYAEVSDDFGEKVDVPEMQLFYVNEPGRSLHVGTFAHSFADPAPLHELERVAADCGTLTTRSDGADVEVEASRQLLDRRGATSIWRIDQQVAGDSATVWRVVTTDGNHARRVDVGIHEGTTEDRAMMRELAYRLAGVPS